MNDLPCQKLRELIAERGPQLCEDHKACRTLLRQRCPDQKKEVGLLIDALQEHVADELRTAPAGQSAEPLIARLSAALQTDLDVSAEEARWAVESWAMALGLITAAASGGRQSPVAEDQQEADAPRSPEISSPPTAQTGPDIESAGHFYLGREYDLLRKTVLTDKPILYDSRDLLTHGVVVGMTGSGKTGLCLSLLEEAALDQIPSIIIDPKGDLTNLLLQFPDLRPEDFKPWVNPDEARQKKVPLDDYARQVAERWKKGILDSGQTLERIADLRDSSEFRIYTPGSEAGLSLSLLQKFIAPKGVSREAMNQKIDATTTAILGLTGISSDPVQSREHILIAQLLQQAWKAGRDMDLAQLISAIQYPPLSRIGTLDVETFYPEKDRLKLAVSLNNILASPSFSTWITGDPLDLGQLMYAGDKPRQLIFYVAHLDDSQRMFFITLLLEEVLSWVRKQPGTTSLRALLYFDEVYGYLPPHPGNPPSKGPLMTLLKQARAFGLGVLLATQNPVDLDYKALSNAGTWFVGKLQTERDKARLIDGLEGVNSERGQLTDKAHLERVISALGSRVFLLHNVHRGQPVLFQSRHALCYLRGPITPDRINDLMAPLKEEILEASGGRQPPVALQQQGADAPRSPADAAGSPEPITHVAPVLTGVPQFYLPLSNPIRPKDAEMVYQPRVLGFATVVFADKKRNIEHRKNFNFLAVPPGSGQAVNWLAAESFTEALALVPDANARWDDVPESLNTAKKIKALEKSYADHLYSHARLTLLINHTLNVVGSLGESREDFQQRCRAMAAEKAKIALGDERSKFAPKFSALRSEVPPEEPPKSQSSGGLLDIFGSLFAPAQPNWQPLVPLTAKEQNKLRELQNDWFQKRSEIVEKWRRVGEECAELQLTPRKMDVQVTQFGLGWAPFWRIADSGGKSRLVAAF